MPPTLHRLVNRIRDLIGLLLQAACVLERTPDWCTFLYIIDGADGGT
jgi:hypothetical protein